MILRVRWLLACVVLGVAGGGHAAAHPFAPGYLELTRTKPGHWQARLRPPRIGVRSQLEPSWGPECRGAPRPAAPPTRRWSVTCTAPLTTIGMTGFTGRIDEVLVRVRTSTSAPGAEVYRLNAARPTAIRPRTPPDPGRWAAFARYFGMGFEHILLGYDHLAFIVLLVLLVPSARAMVVYLSLFTLAHSVTLSLAALGVLVLPSAPTEAVIALSIAFTAREVIRPEAGGAGRAAKLAFGFGLLHGLGLAGALTELGLPPQRQPEALIGFNLGVEGGQLACVVCLLGLGYLVGGVTDQRRRALRWGVAYAVGGAAAFWTTARVMETFYAT